VSEGVNFLIMGEDSDGVGGGCRTSGNGGWRNLSLPENEMKSVNRKCK